MDSDDYTSDDDNDSNYYSDNDDVNFDDNCEATNSTIVKPYTILNESEIKIRQFETINHISSTLFISKPVATTLLYNYRWDSSRLTEEWFSDEERVRTKIGLLSLEPTELKSIRAKSVKLCVICYESFPLDEINFYPSNCGHLFCRTCWGSYISISIEDGPGCLGLKCPYPKCGAAVCRDVVDDCVGPESNEKYDWFLLRSYVEDSKMMKWCPGPGCGNAAEFEPDSEGGFDVMCACGHAFCWNCVEEVHRPVDCETVSNWILKNSSESENTVWILANSKPCPKCHRAIEKNSGCMHMTCTPPCKFEFCWLCLSDWKKHGADTGGFYACNKYESNKVKGVYTQEDLKRERAKNHVGRYTHYYERWDSNHKSRLKAVDDLEKMINYKFAILGSILDKPETEFGFTKEAWEQIIECRRVLRWTYAYGYYIPDNQPRKREFFEYLQGDAEGHLERLHQCVESELLDLFHWTEKNDLLDKYDPSKPYKATVIVLDEVGIDMKQAERPEKYLKFEHKLKNLTKVTGSYFEKLVKELEKGMSAFGSDEGCSEENEIMDADYLNGLDYWTCSECTCANYKTLEVCEMCDVGERI